MNGVYGRGQNLIVIVGACVYTVCRSNKKPLTLNDVSSALQIDAFRLGRVFVGMLKELGIRLEAVDPSVFIERICNIVNLRDMAKLQKVKSQSADVIRLGKKVLSVRCMWQRHPSTAPLTRFDSGVQEWLCTGRAPLPVAVAAVSMVLEANGVRSDMKSVCQQLAIDLRCACVHLNLRIPSADSLV